jgi:hypothetical protein
MIWGFELLIKTSQLGKILGWPQLSDLGLTAVSTRCSILRASVLLSHYSPARHLLLIQGVFSLPVHDTWPRKHSSRETTPQLAAAAAATEAAAHSAALCTAPNAHESFLAAAMPLINVVLCARRQGSKRFAPRSWHRPPRWRQEVEEFQGLWCHQERCVLQQRISCMQQLYRLLHSANSCLCMLKCKC